MFIKHADYIGGMQPSAGRGGGINPGSKELQTMAWTAPAAEEEELSTVQN